MRSTFLLVTVCVMSSSAVAASPPPSPTAATKYCAMPAVGFRMSAEQGVKMVEKICKPGDLVYLPADQPAVIATFCEIDRPMVAVGSQILCVMRKTPLEERAAGDP